MPQAVAVENWLDKSKEVDLSRFQLLRDHEASGKEVAEQLRELRAPDELKELKRMMVDLSRAFSRNYGIRVLPSEDGKWSLAIDPQAINAITDLNAGKRPTILNEPPEVFAPKAIFYNLDDVALALSSEDQIFAKLRHEAAHVRHTDYRYIFEAQHIAKESGSLATTLGLVQLGLEDARVYHKDSGESQGVKLKLSEVLTGKYSEILEKINEQPLARQFSLNLVYGLWLNGKNIPTLIDPRVIEATERLKPQIERYIASNSNSENFELLIKEIAPEIAALEQQSLVDGEKRELIEQIGEGYSKQQKREARFFRRIAQGVKSIFGIKPAPPKLPPDQAELYELAQKNGGTPFRAELAKFVKEQKIFHQERNEKLREKNAEVGYLNDDLDLSSLSSTAQSALEVIHSSLSPALKSKIAQEARASLDEAQAQALNRELPVGLKLKEKKDPKQDRQSEIAPPQEPSQVSEKEQALENIAKELGLKPVSSGATIAPQLTPEQEAAEAKERASAARKELFDREIKRQGFSPEETEFYRSFKSLENSVIGRLAGFLEQLSPYLPKKRIFTHGTELFYTGSRLDRHVISKKAPLGDLRMYQRREPIDSPDPRMFVTLLIDNSGSMKEPTEEKMVESIKTAIFWARALKEMNVPFAIKLFGERVINLKNFEDDYDDPAARIKPKLVQLTDASHHITNVSEPLEAAATEMHLAKRQYRNSLGAIFVISDSLANRGKLGEDLKALVDQVREQFMVTNFILTPNNDEVELAKIYFGERNVVAPRRFADLPSESIRVLRNVLNETFRRTGGIRWTQA